jgi:Tol biopolymer transport system component/DNA-binding winged helix-turn-helix (wHTH) protein
MRLSDRDEVYTFDEYRLDVRERRVWRGTSLIPMSPKTFDLLVVMVQGAGRLLEKEFLIRSVWPDSYVQDANLSVHISNLRKVLGKSSESQQFIETVPKAGYRLVVPVSRTPTFTDEDATVLTHQEESDRAQQIEVEQNPGVPVPTDVQLPQLSYSRRSRLVLNLLFLALCVTGALTASLLTVRAHRNRDAATSTRPLTGTPGQFLQPSFSPDGKELAYTWRSSTDTHQSVYLQSVSSDERRLLADTGGDDYSPVWSPDGSEIAFLHASTDNQPLELIVARKDNPALRRSVTAVCPANDIFRTSPTLSWSPDGHTLVTTDCPAGNGSPAVTLISVKTGQKLSLTHPPSRTWDDQAVFSPDGRQIAFRHSRGDASDQIYLVPSTGGQERELTFRSSQVDGLAWSRDGKRIVFSAGQATSLGSIWSLNLAGGDPVVITTPLTHTSSPAIAPTGHRMAYVNSPKNVSTWRMSTVAHRDAEPFISSNFFDASAVYSPDGRFVAFRSDRSGTNEIWICHSDGTEPKRITHFNGPMTGSPRWSPDGRAVAFDSRVSGHADVYVVSRLSGKSYDRVSQPM